MNIKKKNKVAFRVSIGFNIGIHTPNQINKPPGGLNGFKHKEYPFMYDAGEGSSKIKKGSDSKEGDKEGVQGGINGGNTAAGHANEGIDP